MNSYCEMIIDAASPNFIHQEETNHEEPPNPVAKKFFDMLKVAETPLVESDDRHSVLSACTELLNLHYNISDDEIQEKISERFTEWFRVECEGYDPSVLAHQAEQVSFLPYPGSKRSRTD
ncbi:hypothetical protein M9H77_26708 [Catharanthus roseus]|uniref:Uncharacterized protein n=1 Tax=Catharanthus roseus TaxID=4058 RepID=A0ACC0ABZ7_CATRO|nr:hypothetical protein M9H77_26708 [Catharanthus roseus]